MNKQEKEKAKSDFLFDIEQQIGGYKMLDKIPSDEVMITLIGQPLYDVWTELCAIIDAKYDMEHLWNKGYKEWIYEYKYQRGGKTLCTFYAKEKFINIMVVLGKEEREKFELNKADFSEEVQRIYNASQTYHDGKWLWINLTDTSLFSDMEKLLLLKRKPNKK